MPARTSGSGRVLEPGLGRAVGVPLDEGPADVAVPHQTLDRGELQRERHRVGGGLGGVGDGDDDRVGVERHVLQPGQLLAQRRAAQVDRAVVERAGDVGEVDPLEEAVGVPGRGGEPLDPDAVAVGDRQRARLERPDVLEPEVGQRDALARRGEQRAVLGDAERAEPQGSRATTRSPLAVSSTTL